MADTKEKTKQKRGKRPKKPPKYTGYKRVLYYAYIVLTILSALIVVGYIAFNLFSSAPDLNRHREDPPTESGETVEDWTRPPIPTTTSYIDEQGNLVEVEIEIPGLPADRKQNFYTFLLVGQDQGGVGGGDGGLTDTMILVAYDVPNQKLSLLSLPRDTWVSYRGSTVLLNSVYSRYGAGENGMKHLKRAIAGLTGVNPDFYVMVQWEAIRELVDAIDGVYFDVPFRMYYNDLSQHFKINLQKGYQLLDGAKAMQLIRWRLNSDDSGHIDYSYGYVDGDLGRIKTQQAFLKAVIKKCLQPEVVLNNLGEYITIFQKNVTTNLESGEIAYFVKSAVGGLDMESVSFATLPYTDAGDGAHLLPVGSQIVRLINESFNPYKNNIQLYELTLADHSPLAKTSPEPSESGEIADSPEPGEEDPTASPGESEGIDLPPGTITTEPDPTGSEGPGGTIQPKPTGSAEPGASDGPGEGGASEDPGETTPGEDPSDGAAETPPAETTAEQPHEQGGDDIPDLPPGYLG